VPTDAVTSSGASAGSGTITWGFWGSATEIASHERVAEVFMQEHPNIAIEIWHQPWEDYFTTLETLWASGDQAAIPDVLFLWPAPSYAADGVLENLDPWIEQSSYNLDDYWPALLESASYNGSIYGLPRDIGVEVLYYNKTIFDEAGVPYPAENWTWDNFRAAAEQLRSVESSGRVARYALGMEGGKYGLWINQNRGTILDDMRNPARCTLAEPPARQALQFFADLMRNNLAMPDAQLSQSGGDAAVFQSGLAAMIIQNASRVSAFNAAKMNYGVQVLPIPRDGRRAASAGGAAWVMSAQSDNKEAAWTFLKWLQSTEGGQRIYTEAGEIFPALQSTAGSDAFLRAEQPPANRQAFLTEARHSVVGRFGYFPGWDELEGLIILPELQRLWTGETTVDDAVTQICGDVDSWLVGNGFPRQQ
jgi:multiple sugar transport system substrate-binding protein